LQILNLVALVHVSSPLTPTPCYTILVEISLPWHTGCAVLDRMWLSGEMHVVVLWWNICLHFPTHKTPISRLLRPWSVILEKDALLTVDHSGKTKLPSTLILKLLALLHFYVCNEMWLEGILWTTENFKEARKLGRVYFVAHC
jgi:hypothetical protein